ncbi:unnamed protein product [Trichogramma brassicae]|uniref:RNA-directed DNA polymerase n=1 Tax=Trichogramma brassicae TaxID=86971 RepID=A0A6H5IS36_9HYME|nr:unnamed protein product [Trichogramma brassicae]
MKTLTSTSAVVTTTQSSTETTTTLAYTTTVTTSGGFNSAPRSVFMSASANNMAKFGLLAFVPIIRYQFLGTAIQYPARPPQHTHKETTPALEEHSKPYTAFAVPGSGLWQYTRMPLRMCNAPRMFQRLIDSLFGPEHQLHIFGYATDFFDEHLKWLEVVLTRLTQAGLAVNRKKCEFCRNVSHSEEFRPDPERVAPLLKCKPPQTLKELGCISWYSRFIPMESLLKLSLLKLTKKGVPWKWGPEQQEAFDSLKQALVTAPVLVRPDFTKPFTVQSDASAYTIEALLTQEHEDGEHPIVYNG